MTEHRYDVAISFAGEDRQVARDLATQLLAKKYRVFYDEFYQANLWGADLSEFLDAVFGGQSRYCIIVVSESYATKIWTRYEFRSAMAVALFGGDKDAYILPLRLDDARLAGLRPTIGYLDLRNLSLESVVKLLIQKLGLPVESEAAEPNEVTGVEEVLSLCYRRSIFARLHYELSEEAMFESMHNCRVALQQQIVYVRPREAQQLVASIIAELDLMEGVHKKMWTEEGKGIDAIGTIDSAKLRVIAVMQMLAKMSNTPLELPNFLTEEDFSTQEEAEGVPSGPESLEYSVGAGGGLRS